MKSVSFLEALIATHFAFLLVALAAGLFLRGIRRSLERLVAELEAAIPTATKAGR